MNFDMPADDDPRRLEIRAWLADHPNPSNADLHAAGYIVPHWPPPYGLGADPMHQLIIDDEMKRAGVGRTSNVTNAIGVGWAAPTILLAGSEWQKERFLPPIFDGTEIWCQLFSEPDAGSDLASLGTRAVKDGDEYVINGSKIWTSGAHRSQFGILIARTDPEVAKHKGISYFIVPMDTPGVTLSPIVDMTTAHSFNETHFDDVRLHEKYRVGAEGDGWRLAKVTPQTNVSHSLRRVRCGEPGRRCRTCSQSSGPAVACPMPTIASVQRSCSSSPKCCAWAECAPSVHGCTARLLAPRRRSKRSRETSTAKR